MTTSISYRSRADLAAFGFKMPEELLLDLFVRDPRLMIDVILGKDPIRLSM
jgi:hypothetical protein